uniref:Uncharacterized protein n=1 Tax=Arundo donax TaxID=35708 RepID=A0A0A9GTC4_ARUDO
MGSSAAAADGTNFRDATTPPPPLQVSSLCAPLTTPAQLYWYPYPVLPEAAAAEGSPP